ncbi:prophage tail fiber N-terminal domain-containing protein [Aeromonas veronii]|uniref:prophage tail fiber N-terminal domain-containing protein n=1 Tax=Aeromonas veronii TaxID=654 RepID=UPI001431872A|nr:prophage tail fiber N-terminal domain-containing protein [Aeromonas veronii]NJI09031.1 hypothetical protein [Aeromonas veronii]
MIRIFGTMTDPSGSPVPGAIIELRAICSTSEVLLGSTVTIKCDQQGAYSFQLAIGTYDAYAQNDRCGDMDYLGTARVSDNSVDGDLHSILIDGGINITPPMLESALAAAQRAESAAALTAADRVSTGQNAESAKADSTAAKTAKDEAVSAKNISVEAADTATQKAASAATHDSSAQAAAASINPEAGTGKLMRIGGPAILDSERYSLERATGGRQTIIRDSAGNANAMFVLPRFRYEDLGMAADMGAGDVSAFDFGSGSIKSEIFIGAYLASGGDAVSAPMKDPRTSLDHTAARAACAAKGAGWHLMTTHEWAAIALWCMANGYEPVGNTNYGRSHAKTWIFGGRADGLSPGDTAGVGRTHAGSMGSEVAHDRTLGGIADLVGNIWEWQEGFMIRDGRIIVSTHNAQAESEWVAQPAYFDVPTSAIELSGSVTHHASVRGEWRSIGKSATYTSSQLLKRMLIEPSTVLPRGLISVNNLGEKLPLRGGAYDDGDGAGMAALHLGVSRHQSYGNVGFRPVFA